MTVLDIKTTLAGRRVSSILLLLQIIKNTDSLHFLLGIVVFMGHKYLGSYHKFLFYPTIAPNHLKKNIDCEFRNICSMRDKLKSFVNSVSLEGRYITPNSSND